MNKKQYKKGHFIWMGMAFGLPIGIPVGAVLGNIAFGPGIGLSIGMLIGSIMEKKLNKNPIDLTEIEKKRIKKWSLISMIAGLLIFILVLILYFYI